MAGSRQWATWTASHLGPCADPAQGLRHFSPEVPASSIRSTGLTQYSAQCSKILVLEGEAQMLRRQTLPRLPAQSLQGTTATSCSIICTVH